MKQSRECSIEAKQGTEIQIQNKWDWVETSIWTERMLTALENGVKGGKWFSLIDKVFSEKTLRAAWNKVKSKRGAGGVDGITVKRFESNAERYIGEVQKSLKEGSYTPQGIRRVYIPKGKGKLRPIGIPTVKDRIVETAILYSMEPIFEKEFNDVSYGFRPNRGCKDALREVDRLLKSDHIWVVDADLKNYFDSIPHDSLIRKIEEKVSDGRVLSLIKKYLKQEIFEEVKQWIPDKGTPQGAVISPLLSNVYLHGLDKEMTRRGYKMVRYADDFVILCKTKYEAERAMKYVEEWIKSNGLELNADKSHIGNCTIKGQGFEFLGYRFEAGFRHVRKKSFNSLKDKIRNKTFRTRGESLSWIIEDLNRTLKGWFEYFKHSHKYTFKVVDQFVRRRLRALLRKQNKRPGSGKTLKDHMTWPNAFFAKQGLFTMYEAYVLAVQSRCGNC
jgi:RNA-directed DNA polymerase